MSSALIVGDRGSGLTTFVGLLYTAQVRYGTETMDEFRFHADRESIRMLQGIYGAIGDGRFPDTKVDWERQPLSFVFGFRRGRFWGSALPSAHAEDTFDLLRVRVGSLPAEDVVQLHEHDAVLDEPTRRLLRSPVLVPLVDASWLSPDPEGIDGLPMQRYDGFLSGTIRLLEGYLAGERRRRDRRMFPMFVVTKFDRIRPEVLQILKAPSGAPEVWDPRERAEFGSRLMQRYLPKTARFFGARRLAKIVIETPVWFFSELQTEDRADGELRIRRRLRIPDGGWEPVYPFLEYRSLLTHFGGLAHRLPPDLDD